MPAPRAHLLLRELRASVISLGFHSIRQSLQVQIMFGTWTDMFAIGFVLLLADELADEAVLQA